MSNISKLLLLITLSLSSVSTYAGYYRQELTVAIGMVNTSFAENSDGDATSDPDFDNSAQSGATSQISIDFSWRFLSNFKRNYYIRGIVPLISSGGTGYFGGAIGANFFFKSTSTHFETRYKGVAASISPEWRYYWGPEIGIANHVYETPVAEKSDTVFSIGAHVGANYNLNPNWGFLSELHVARDTGVATSGFTMRILFGMTYYLELE